MDYLILAATVLLSVWAVSAVAVFVGVTLFIAAIFARTKRRTFPPTRLDS